MGIERGIQTPIRIESRDPVPLDTIHVRESTSDQHLAIGLEGHGFNPKIRPGTEHGIRAALGIKSGVQTAVRIEPGDSVTAYAADLRESATD